MIKLNFVCFGNHSGYAQAAQDLIFALNRTGEYDIRVEFLYKRNIPREGMSKERSEIIRSMVEKDKTHQHIQIYNCIPSTQKHVRKTSQNIGFATFETFQPPNTGYMNWISLLNKNDAIIVPSNFDYKIFAHEKIEKPLFYIPHCFDDNHFNLGTDPLNKYDKFSFLFFGSWRIRKGYEVLIEAWLKEFSVNDNVQLVIKTDKGSRAKSYINKIKKEIGFEKKETAPILFENSIFDEINLARFMKSFDCLISPTMGEGFGLPGLQCMALGTPVIITDFSGCQDYANEETATLLKPEGFRLYQCMDNLPQFKNKKWPFISVSSVRKTMRSSIENKEKIKQKASYAHKFVNEKFTYHIIAKMFRNMLRATFNV